MRATIAVLAGDGIGPEVTAAARRVLSATVAGEHELVFVEHDVGGVAIDRHGEPLPEATLGACLRSDAVLLGAVGGPRWDPAAGGPRPEAGLLQLRRELGLFANLRPVRVFDAVLPWVPVKPEIVSGTDVLFVRELTGGVYFGPRREAGDDGEAFDTMVYSRPEIERVSRVAFRAAEERRGRVTSIDKANVLASMRLWRRTVDEVGRSFPAVELDHQLVDSAAMRLISDPRGFDVVLTPNLFGDVLSDEASVLAGSLGLLPSASIGEGRRGLYEPVHGSAPDIAGRGSANPVGAILSAAMLLRHSLGLVEEATRIEDAVRKTLAAGVRTADLIAPGEVAATTEEVTTAVVRHLR